MFFAKQKTLHWLVHMQSAESKQTKKDNKQILSYTQLLHIHGIVAYLISKIRTVQLTELSAIPLAEHC